MSVDAARAGEVTRPDPARIYGAVLGVGVVCALAIVTVYEFTRPIILRNRLALTRRAVFEVLPGASAIRSFQFTPAMSIPEPVSVEAPVGDVLYAGFDDQGELIGLAIEAHGMGYQDVIRLLYGYSFDQNAVIGIRVLESRETPGLGDRIEKNADFLGNFEQLDVSLNEQGDQVVNRIEFVKSGEKNAAWQIDGITGATISSRAVSDMLSESTSEWIPRLHGQQAAFSVGAGETS